jgi:hypothetical protein
VWRDRSIPTYAVALRLFRLRPYYFACGRIIELVVEGRQVVAAFDGGEVTSDAWALLLAVTDRAIGW